MYRIDTDLENAIYSWVYKTLNPNALQKISFDAVGSAGTLTLTLDAETTAPIAFDADAATIKTALELLTNINEVTVYYDMPALNLVIEFTGVDAATAFNNITADVTLLTGVTTATTTAMQTANTTPITVDWAFNDDQTIQPVWPYAVLNIRNLTEESKAARTYKETDIYTEKHFYNFDLEINIFGDSRADHRTLNYMKRLTRSYGNPVLTSNLRSADLAWRSYSGIRDLSAVQAVKHELRAQCQFNFGFAEEIEVVLGEIRRVSGTGTATTDKGTTVNTTFDESI